MHTVRPTGCCTRYMAQTNMNSDRSLAHLPLSTDGSYITVAVAERLESHPDLAAVVVFVVGGGETRLVAHAVVPAPAEWGPREHGEGTFYDGWLTKVGWALVMSNFGGDPVVDQVAALARLTGQTQITTRIFRSVTTGDLERWARQQISSDVKLRDGWGVVAGGDRKQRKQRGGGDRRLAEIAARYVELLDETATPIPTLADEFAISKHTASSYLYRARERDLLTSPGQGRAGGALTPRARALLDGTAE